MSAGDPLLALLERHCASLDDEIGTIESKLAPPNLKDDRWREALNEIAELVHKINGSSGSLGFLCLSQAAARLEDALNDLTRAEQAPQETDILHACRLFDVLREAAQSAAPEHSRLFGVDLNSIGRKARA